MQVALSPPTVVAPLMKPQAFLVLLLVAALAVAGYFLSLGGDEVAPANLPGGPAHSSNDGVAGQANVASVGGTGQPQGPKLEIGLTRTAAPEVTSTEASAKGSMLRGRIVDGAGSPRGGLALSVDIWGADQIVELSEMRGGRNETRKEVTTAADGTFVTRIAAKRSGTISLPGDELVFAERLRFMSTGAEQDLGDLVVVLSARLAGIVQDEDGKPVAGVMVAAERGAMGFDRQSNAKSRDDGTFSVGKLRSGNWVLTTKSSQFLPTSRKVELADEQQVTDLVIVVMPGRAIAGRVIDDRGVGVAGMKVASQRKQILNGVDIQRFTTDEAALTDELGNFRLAGLEGNTTTIRATGPGHTKAAKSNVKTGSSNVELRVERLGAIHGVLVTADGTPIVGSRVNVKSQQRNGGALEMAEGLLDFDIPGSGPSVKTDEQGKFVLDSVKPGVVTVRARGKTHLPTDQAGLRVRAAQTVRGIRLQADAGAVARIKVVDVEGTAILGAKVMIRLAPKAATPGFSMRMRASSDDGNNLQIGSSTLGSGMTDEDGVATIMGLPGGEAVVSATHADYAPSADTRVVMPSSGSIDRQVAMSPPSFVEVVVSNTDGSVCVGTDVLLEVSKDDTANAIAGLPGMDRQGLLGTKTTDADGKVRFGPVSGGEYVASLSRGKKARGVGGMMMFTGDENDKIASSATSFAVAAGKTVSVLLTKPILARLFGVVMGSDGPVVGCGVELESAVGDADIPGLGGSQQRTNEDGTFTFEGVESGDYVLRYGKDDQIVKARYELTVPPNTPTVHQDLTLRTGTVRVLVLSKDNAEPVERAEVRLTRGGKASKSGQPQRRRQVVMIGISSDGNGEETSTMTFGQERVLTDEDGIAEFKDVPVGDYTLKVESRKYSPAEKGSIAVVELQLTDCGTIELAGAGQIRGMVKNEAGKRMMALVEHRLLGSADWSRGELAMRGSYRLTGVAPGRYEVRARSIGAVTGDPSEPQIVEVEVGKTEVANLSVK